MSSGILAVYNTIAATTITVNTITVTVYDADELPNSVPAASLPVRLLTPLSPFGVEVGARSDTIPKGGSMPYIVDWTIADILLWNPVATDVGIKAHAKELLAYCVQYLEMLKTLNVTMVTAVSLVPDVINYPTQSANWYYGVRAILEIKEKFI